LRNGIAVRLAQGSQLLAAISPQSLVSLYAQRRQNAVDLVDDRDRRSPVKSSRSRYARRASSSASLGIGTIEQTRGSPRSQAIKVRSNISTSMISVFARRARRSTGRLDGWITWTSMPRRARKRASQNPSRPASWVSMTRAILRPAAAHLAFRRSTNEANPSRKLPAHVANAG
jgi:hypothetical protein